MKEGQQAEALRLADDLVEPIDGFQEPTMLEVAAAAELRRQHARIAELEADLEAVGAGGVQSLRKQAAAPQAVQAAVPVEKQIESVLMEIGKRDEAWCEWQNAISDRESELFITEKQKEWLRAGSELRALLKTLISGAQCAAPVHPADVVPDHNVQPVLGWIHKLRNGKIGSKVYTYEPHCDCAVRDDGGEKIAVVAATHPTQQGLDAQALKQSFREYLSVSEHIDAGGHAMDSIATDLTRIVLTEEEVSAVIARRVHCNTSGQAGEDAANIRAAAQAKQGEQA